MKDGNRSGFLKVKIDFVFNLRGRVNEGRKVNYMYYRFTLFVLNEVSKYMSFDGRTWLIFLAIS